MSHELSTTNYFVIGDIRGEQGGAGGVQDDRENGGKDDSCQTGDYNHELTTRLPSNNRSPVSAWTTGGDLRDGYPDFCAQCEAAKEIKDPSTSSVQALAYDTNSRRKPRLRRRRSDIEGTRESLNIRLRLGWPGGGRSITWLAFG